MMSSVNVNRLAQDLIDHPCEGLLLLVRMSDFHPAIKGILSDSIMLAIREEGGMILLPCGCLYMSRLLTGAATCHSYGIFGV